MFVKKYLKWISTFLVLVGILLTNLNIYPLNIYFHGLGVVGWTVAGFISKDKAILTNFGLQIPKNSRLYLLYFIPSLSWKFDRYFDNFELLISFTSSHDSQIENAVAFAIVQAEFLQAINAFLLSILWIFPISTNLSNAL